jgi:ABC-type branched-subunit amino acid transport system substrate-binding protein
MSHQKTWRWLAATTVVAVLLAACGSSSNKAKSAATPTTKAAATNNDRGNVDGTLTLGALLPQSGDLSAIYKSLNTPVTMAVDEINAAGGVNGKPVVVKEADDGTSADVASTSLDTLLASDKVDAILGPYSSPIAEVVETYHKEFPGADLSYHSAAGNSGCQILVDTVKSVGSLDRERLREQILKTDVHTVFGAFKADQAGFQTAHKTLLFQWQDGKKAIVWPEELAADRPRFPTPPWNHR